MGRRPNQSPDPRQEVHLGRHLRALAHRRPAAVLPALRDERGAQSRLDDIIDGETRNVIANHDLIEVVRSTNRTFERSEEDART